MKKEINELKYTEAYDIRQNKMIKPFEVNRADSHDRNRYFSEKFLDIEDKGKVLTLHKESKSYKSKNGKNIVRQAHFVAIADNTVEYRKNTAEKVKRQESLVHKLCKEEIKQIEYIKIQEVKADILGEDVLIIPEQYIKIKCISSETKEEKSGKIPDITLETTILGKKQTLLVEFYYQHEVTEQKRKQYNYYNINCIEIDISELRDNLEENEKTLRNKIRSIIKEKSYWISNKAKELIEKESIRKYVLELSIKEGNMQKTLHYDIDRVGSTDEWLKHRLFTFKSSLQGINETHPYFFIENADITYLISEKCVEIGNCSGCKNCIYIKGYADSDIRNTRIFCRKDGKNEPINPSKLMKDIIDYTIKNL